CAKKALLRPIISIEELKEKAKTSQIADMELKILEGIQKTGIGTQGLGGSLTAFGVSVETYPCHIASMPVAVNINCHAARHAEITLNDSTNIPDEIIPEFEIPEFKKSDCSTELKKVSLPLQQEDIENLKAGESILLNGYMYTGRDAAHKRLLECVKNNQTLPVDLKGQTIYYVGPCPAKENEVIGPAGPTTSGRMDAYTPDMLKLGLKGMIGKGYRNYSVIEAIKEYKAIYFVSTGGAGALLAQKIKEAEVVAYEDLGPEAIYKLKIEDFPVTVCIDSKGNNYYEIGKALYEKK
ncbi:MAG: Fe-S-containing hydro-lyase, partial [Vampirovibrionia bacterium]